MIFEADARDKNSQLWAENKIAELKATWEATVQPRLSVVLETLERRLQGFGSELSGREIETLMEDTGLQHARGRAQSLDQFFFPQWVAQVSSENLNKLQETASGVRSSNEARQLRGKGQVLLQLLGPIVSDEVTTSWLDRSGFNGTWTGL